MVTRPTASRRATALLLLLSSSATALVTAPRGDPRPQSCHAKLATLAAAAAKTSAAASVLGLALLTATAVPEQATAQTYLPR